MRTLIFIKKKMQKLLANGNQLASLEEKERAERDDDDDTKEE